MPSPFKNVLLVDDDPTVLQSTSRILEEEFHLRSLLASTGGQCLEAMGRQSVSLVLLDLGLPDLAGEDVLTRLQKDYPEVPVIIVTALAEVDSAVRCMGKGAFDYVVKGSDAGRLVNSVKRALESRKKDLKIAALREGLQATNLKNPGWFSELITANDRMRALFRFIEVVASSDECILLQGETGTGKELFARAIHKASGTSGPFLATNLGGLEDLLVSDTLFGHVKGAYTGADEARKGLVFQASTGTLFLDEIGDLSPQSQVKLLRFLENREYFPLGTDLARRSEARIVAATNMNLESRADTGLFRRDLLFRLSTYRIDIPPLRERSDDIPLLCRHFLPNFAITPGALEMLGAYGFPGNVRELRGLLLKAKALSEGNAIAETTVEGLLTHPPKVIVPPREIQAADAVASELPTIHQAIERLVDEALRRAEGRQTTAAKLLGISPQALSKRLKQREKGP